VRFTRVRRAAGLVLVTATVLAGAACAPPSDSESSSSGSGGAGGDAASATSAEDFGGMDALVAAAQKEGELNVIALPPDWANYGEIITAFQDKYKIKVNSAQPDASSADEISAAKTLKGQASAPDVFDLGASVAAANTDMFAPYKVETFDEIPDNLKAADGTWVNDYGGYMSVGYDPSKVPAPTSLADLLKPEYNGKVALNGDPTKAGAAFAAVQMAAIASGGSASDITKGVDYFGQLYDAGNRLRLGLPQRLSGGETEGQDGMEDVPAHRGGRGRVLRAGDQRRRPTPGRGSALAGVPLLRPGPEPVVEGRRPPGAAGGDDQGRNR
jgi:putative spermidine/putrescine transport system substrate-binding protein